MHALLTYAWLFLNKWLNRLLLLLPAVDLSDQAIGSLYYAWELSDPVSAEEQITPDEARITQAIIQDAIRVVEQHRDNIRILRGAHTKAHGCVKAEFRIRANPDPTPCHGMFVETGKSWNAWVRFSNGNAYPQFDSKGDARDMTVRLPDIPGEKLPPDHGHDDGQGSIIFSQSMFFTRDIAEYRQNFVARANGEKAPAFFPNWDPTSQELHHLLVALRTLAPALDSPLHTGYNGISSCKLGEHNIRFRVTPASEKYPVYQLPKQNQDLPSFLRAVLCQQLSIDRTPVCYAFQVQHQNPGKYMPIEDTGIEWKESGASFATITDIIVPTWDFNSREQNLFYNNPSFSPQRAPLGHRSIGGISWLRRAVYEAVSEHRLGRNG